MSDEALARVSAHRMQNLRKGHLSARSNGKRQALAVRTAYVRHFLGRVLKYVRTAGVAVHFPLSMTYVATTDSHHSLHFVGGNFAKKSINRA